MLASLAPLFFLAQAGQAGQAAPEGMLPQWLVVPVQWLWVFGDPAVTINDPFTLSLGGTTLTISWIKPGNLITWVKILGLLSLMGWVGGRVVKSQKERTTSRLGFLSIASIVSVVGLLGVATLQILQETKRLPMFRFAGIPLVIILAVAFLAVILAWVEKSLWTTLGRIGQKGDRLVLVGIHLALALGIWVSLQLIKIGVPVGNNTLITIAYGARLGLTYMGFVVLTQLLLVLGAEVLAVRFRRLYAIGMHSVIESNRRMWAPYVVVVIFLVILAFTHWFLPANRAAEMGRLYVGTLSLLCSMLLTFMIVILAPISLPQDIRMQTIYTIVSKPVRRIELIWGRIFGFMALVTVLLLVFGAISLLYLSRTVGGTIADVKEQAKAATAKGQVYQAKMLRDQADQLETRMAARVQHKGSLGFIDSLGKPQYKGIDVGQELEKRSFVEGATPSEAIWNYGVFRDPLDPKTTLDRRVPVAQFLRANTIEALEDQSFRLKIQARQAEDRKRQPGAKGQDITKMVQAGEQALASAKPIDAEVAALKQKSRDLLKKAAEAEKAGQGGEAAKTRIEEARLHSPSVPLEMTFTVYRTTKGIVGDPVYASIVATNPYTLRVFKDTFAIREYYTNKLALPPSLLAGSMGALKIEIRCLSPTQYLGMAESDLYLVSRDTNFGINFMKGMFGIWIQAMVLTAIGVFAGTFLSWPVALLLTLAFFIAGQVAFSFLQQFALQTLASSGGGPFESLIRLLAHENLVNELTPTFDVVIAKTLDSLVMPVMSRLVYIVPNFSALDVSNTVSEGYAVGWDLIAANLLMGLAYAIPFSIAGYFIMKNREVAA